MTHLGYDEDNHFKVGDVIEKSPESLSYNYWNGSWFLVIGIVDDISGLEQYQDPLKRISVCVILDNTEAQNSWFTVFAREHQERGQFKKVKELEND